MAMYMRDSGTTSISTGTANKFGQMEPHMRGNGGMTRLTAKENSLTQTEMSMKAISKTTRLMALGYIHTIMGQFTKATGNSMPTMEKVWKQRTTARNTKANLKMAKSMEEATKYLQMGPPMKAIGIKGSCTDKALTSGRMGGNTGVNGNIMIWMATDSLLGMMVEYIKVHSKKIKGTEKEYNSGPTAAYMTDNGNMVSSMGGLGTRA